jgi:hypothetical protein
MRIPLSKCYYAEVDDADGEWLTMWAWHVKEKGRTCYAVRREGGQPIYMHREITNAPRGMVVDHIDGDGLNNRRENLRVCLPIQNAWNQHRGPKQGTHAMIEYFGNRIHLGQYATPEEAAAAEEEARQWYYGEFASRERLDT